MNKLTNGKALRPPGPADYETDFVLWSERPRAFRRREQGSYAAVFFTTVKTAYCGV